MGDELVLEIDGGDALTLVADDGDVLDLYTDGYIPDHSIPASKLDVTIGYSIDADGDLTISLT